MFNDIFDYTLIAFLVSAAIFVFALSLRSASDDPGCYVENLAGGILMAIFFLSGALGIYQIMNSPMFSQALGQ